MNARRELMDWETTIKTLRMAVDCIGPAITALGAIALFFKRVRKYLYLVLNNFVKDYVSELKTQFLPMAVIQ